MSNKAVSTLKGIIPNIILIFCIGVVIIIFPTEPFKTNPINVITAADLSLIPCNELKPQPVIAERINKNYQFPPPTKLIGGDLTKLEPPSKKTENITPTKTENIPPTKTEKKPELLYTDDEILFHESLTNYASFNIPGTKEKACKEFKDFKASQIFTYLLFSSCKVCSNMTDTMINLISKILHIRLSNFFPCVLIFYIFIIGVIMAFSQFINLFIPINIKIKKSSALIYDILFSTFGVLAVLYVTCLLPTILIYFIYLIKFMGDKEMPPLIKLICFIMASTTLSVFTPLILDSVGKEGATNKKKKDDGKKKKDTKKRRDGIKSKKANTEDDAEDDTNNNDADKASKNAWGYLSFISIIIPIFSCIYSLVNNFASGNRNITMTKLANVGWFGLIILVIIIFLEIYTPYVNTLLELF